MQKKLLLLAGVVLLAVLLTGCSGLMVKVWYEYDPVYFYPISSNPGKVWKYDSMQAEFVVQSSYKRSFTSVVAEVYTAVTGAPIAHEETLVKPGDYVTSIIVRVPNVGNQDIVIKIRPAFGDSNEEQ